MADVNLQLVREFFELHLFRVLTNWQQDPAWERAGELGPQMFVDNAQPVLDREPRFVLRPVDLYAIERAIVEVRAWHTDRFYPSVVEASPILWQFVQKDALSLARNVFDGQLFRTILVISELPASAEQRQRTIDLLRENGVGHVLEFPTILQQLLNLLSANTSYGASQTLQTLRLLKRYRLVRHQQMEFPFRPDPAMSPPAFVETVEVPEDDTD
ncbi:MAG: hypothetical protein KJ052_08190 [Candidatus Hydrogenedentes bacterium]|nr:hypothetical protein [Candidatus Hydrogenedentota bacterium]